MKGISTVLIENAEAFLAEDFKNEDVIKNNARVALREHPVTRRCILNLRGELCTTTLLRVPVFRVMLLNKVTRKGRRGVLIPKGQDAYILSFFKNGAETFDVLSPSDKLWVYTYGKGLSQVCWDEISGSFDTAAATLGTVRVPSGFSGKVRVKPQAVGAKTNVATQYARCYRLDFGSDSCLWVDESFLKPWNPYMDLPRVEDIEESGENTETEGEVDNIDDNGEEKRDARERDEGVEGSRIVLPHITDMLKA